MRHLFFIGLVLLAVTSFAQTETDPFDAQFANLYPSGWHMLEDIFIKQPQERIDASWGKKALIVTAALITGGGVMALGKKTVSQFSRPLQRKQNLLAGSIALPAAYVTYAGLRKYLIGQEEKKQLDYVMRNWAKLKDYIPEQLVKGMNELAQAYQTRETNYVQHREEALRLIKNAIYEEFPETYSKRKWSDFFSDRRLHVHLNIQLLEMAERAYQWMRRTLF